MKKNEELTKNIPVITKSIKKISNGTLVLEGGAFRGIYVSGVLDCLLDNNINIKKVIGVSAGAINGMNYVAGNRGRGAILGIKHGHNPKLISAKNYVKNKNLLNADFWFNEFNEEIPLCTKNLFNSKRELIALATNVDTGETESFSTAQGRRIFDGIKASSALPCLSTNVKIGEKEYLDGGCVNELALGYALKEKMKKIIVVTTKPKNFRYTPLSSRTMEYGAIQKFYKNKENFVYSFGNSGVKYNQDMDLAKKLEKEGKIIYICPSKEIDVSRMENDAQKLKELYELGYQDALKQLEKIKKFLKRIF